MPREWSKGLAVNDHDLPVPLPERTLDRRRLLKDASLLAGGAAAASVLGADLAAAGPARTTAPVIRLLQTSATPEAAPLAPPVDLANYVPNHFTAAELTTLKAALDRLIPSDDLGPGANEAGVFVYIDRSLGGLHADALPVYQAGLAALDTAAGSGGFAGLAAEKRDAILTDAEGGKLNGAPAGFFATLLAHTREGMFCDPVHGGNVNFAGWDLIGYPGVKLIWTAEDQAVNSTPKPEHISVAQYRGGA
jgi:gluconate 2-dehydrogenase gamma chain